MFTLTLVALLLFNCPYVAPAVIGTRIQDRTGIVQTFLSYMSPMGMTIKSKGEEGLLVLSSPKNSSQHNEYACSPVLPARPRIISGFPWVLLIRQGKCEFATKLLNAQDAGYELVIVYNDQDDHILPMDGIYHFYLKAVFVGLSSGEVLKQYYLFSKNPTARVTLTPYYTISWRMYIIPFLVVIGICCVLMLIFLLIKKVRRYQRRRRARLPASKLKKLKIIVFSDKNIAYDMCAICLDDFEDGDKLRILPCNHGFHSHCIDPWLTKRRRVCPCCKQVVFPEAPPNETQSLPSLSSTYDEERSIGPSVVPDETTPLVP